MRSMRADLPEALLARWASVFFSLSVLSFLLSIAASQLFLAAAGVAYGLHVLRDRPYLPHPIFASPRERGARGEGEARPYIFPPVTLPLALFSVLTVVSVLSAGNPAGWFAVRKLVLFAILVLAVNLIVSAAHLEFLYRALFAESALAGLVAAGQFVSRYGAVRAAYPNRIYYYMTLERIHGFMGHWMNFSGQQMLVFVMLLAFLLLARDVAASSSRAGEKAVPSSRGAYMARSAMPRTGVDRIHRTHRYSSATQRRAIGRGILAIIGISIALSLTRGVWLGSLVAAMYVVGRWRPAGLWAVPILLVASYLAAPGVIRQRANSVLHPGRDPALAVRFEMLHVARGMIKRHPWVGVGPGNIEKVYLLYLPRGEAPITGYHEHLHNNFLQIAAERGLPSLIAWVWLLAALGWHMWRIRRRTILGGHPIWFVDGAIAAWLAFLVEGCFEFNFGTSPVLMVFLFVMSTPFVVERLESQSKVES